MSELSHQRIADSASVWLSKPFSSLVVQELSTMSYAGGVIQPQFRMDVVAVIPNGQRIRVVECKASRADFLRGREKLEVYRDFCHQLYVAAPRGMIEKDELPKGVGLLAIGPKGGARIAHHPGFGQTVSPERYALMLERVLQKLVIARWQAPWLSRKRGSEAEHWPGDGCENFAQNRHQADLHKLAWEDWIAATEHGENGVSP